MNLDLEKYTLKSNIDEKIGLLNNSKQMIENSKNEQELEKAISYAEFVLDRLSTELSNSKKKIK